MNVHPQHGQPQLVPQQAQPQFFQHPGQGQGVPGQVRGQYGVTQAPQHGGPPVTMAGMGHGAMSGHVVHQPPIPSGYPAQNLPGNMVEGHRMQVMPQNMPQYPNYPVNQGNRMMQPQTYNQSAQQHFPGYRQQMVQTQMQQAPATVNVYQQQQFVHQQQRQPQPSQQGYYPQQHQQVYHGQQQPPQQYAYPVQQQQQSQNFQHSMPMASPPGYQAQGYPRGAAMPPQRFHGQPQNNQMPGHFSYPSQQGSQQQRQTSQQTFQGGYVNAQQQMGVPPQQMQMGPQRGMMVQQGPPPRYPGPPMQTVGVEQRPRFVGQRYLGPPVGARMPDATSAHPRGALPVDPLIKRQQQHMQAFRNPRPINPLHHQEQMRMQMSQQRPQMLSPNSQRMVPNPHIMSNQGGFKQEPVKGEPPSMMPPNVMVMSGHQPPVLQQSVVVQESKPPALQPAQSVSETNQIPDQKPPAEIDDDKKPVLESLEVKEEEVPSGQQVQKVFIDKVPVPVGWRRLILSESVVYYSPSGVNMKSVENVRAYLLQEGTCKCGLECPFDVEKTFDFDHNKQSEVVSLAMDHSVLQKSSCTHQKIIGTFALHEGSQNFMEKIKHVNNPMSLAKKSGTKRRRKKQKPFSGMKVAEMLEAREAERQRINEIIMEQKREYEESLQKSLGREIDSPGDVNDDGSSQASVTSTVDDPEQRDRESSQGGDEETEHPDPEVDSQEKEANEVNEAETEVTETRDSTEETIETHDEAAIESEILEEEEHLNDEMEEPDAVNRDLQSPDAEDNASQEDAESRDGEGVVLNAKEEESIEREMDSEDEDQGSDAESSPDESEEQERTVNKNLEIRRISATNDGDKILSDAWDSPEKDGDGNEITKVTKKTPLEMVANIVSNMDTPTPTLSSGSTSGTDSPVTASPIPGPSSAPEKPMEPKKPAKKNALLPPLPHNPPSWIQMGKPQMLSQQQSARMPLQIGTAPMMMQQVPAAVVVSSSSGMALQTSGGGAVTVQGGQPMMQLVNTINGPMLMQAVPFNSAEGSQAGIVQAQQAAFVQSQSASVPGVGQQVGNMFPQGKPGLKKRTKKKQKDSKASPIPGGSKQPHQQVPVLISPQGAQTQQQMANQPGANAQPQFLTIASQPSPNSGNLLSAGSPSPQALLPQQNIIFNQATGAPQMVATNLGNQMIMSNGAFVTALPAMQTTGVVLNQLPDGSFVQMPPSSQAGLITQMPVIQGGQQIFTATGGSFIMNPSGAAAGAPAGGQFIPGNGAFIMAPNQPGVLQQQGQHLISPVRSTQSTTKVTPPKQGSGRSSTVQELEKEEEESNESSSESESESEDEDNEEVDSESEEEEDDQEKEAERLAQEMLAKSEEKRKRKSSLKSTKPKVKVNRAKETRSRNYSSGKKASPKATARASSSSKTPKSSPEPSTSKRSPPKIFIQSNQVDSSGLKATPPHHSSADFDSHHPNHPSSYSKSDDDEDEVNVSGGSSNLSPGEGTSSGRKRRKRNAVQAFNPELNKSEDEEDSASEEVDSRNFAVGEVVWGAHGNFPSWPGKLISTSPDRDSARVCWFGTKEISEVNPLELKSLSDGLEAHHRERSKLRKGRKMNASLEKAIQEAMTELD